MCWPRCTPSICSFAYWAINTHIQNSHAFKFLQPDNQPFFSFFLSILWYQASKFVPNF
jgi:hypothetical protein